jgi:hypothetical protein
LNIPIKVSLTEFIRTGTFGFLRLGMTKDEIESQLFAPENWSEKDKRESSIWAYGNFELHFGKSTLFMIFNDYLHQLDGGTQIQLLDRWILPEAKLFHVVSELNKMRVDFAKVTDRLLGTRLNLSNGVSLYFESDAETVDVNQTNMGSMSLGPRMR